MEQLLTLLQSKIMWTNLLALVATVLAMTTGFVVDPASQASLAAGITTVASLLTILFRAIQPKRPRKTRKSPRKSPAKPPQQ